MKNGLVSASELARMGYCETELAMERQHGRRVTPTQEQARARGNRAHTAFLEESLRIAERSQRRGYCFVATRVFGPDAPETRELRVFRDIWLRRTVVGRWMVHSYYAVSRRLLSRMAAGGATERIARVVLRRAVAIAKRLNRRALR